MFSLLCDAVFLPSCQLVSCCHIHKSHCDHLMVLNISVLLLFVSARFCLTRQILLGLHAHWISVLFTLKPKQTINSEPTTTLIPEIDRRRLSHSLHGPLFICASDKSWKHTRIKWFYSQYQNSCKRGGAQFSRSCPPWNVDLTSWKPVRKQKTRALKPDRRSPLSWCPLSSHRTQRDPVLWYVLSRQQDFNRKHIRFMTSTSTGLRAPSRS